MKPLEMWSNILHKANQSEYELHTVPKTKRDPLWFMVEADDNTVIIKKSASRKPSVQLSGDRRISYKDFELVFGYYDQWKNETPGIRRTVANQSRNTAYIFALIADNQPQ